MEMFITTLRDPYNLVGAVQMVIYKKKLFHNIYGSYLCFCYALFIYAFYLCFYLYFYFQYIDVDLTKHFSKLCNFEKLYF